MKILHFTDKHDHPFNEFSKPTKDGRTTLLLEHYATYDWIAQQIVLHRPDVVVNGGDSVLTIGYVDALTITCVEYGDKVIRAACREVGAKYRPMIGNHDLMNDATRIHVLPFIDDLVTDAVIEDNMFYFPFYRDWSPVWDQWRDRAAKCEASFVHLDVVGARFNFASTCKAGISPSDFPTSCLVVAGHFHHPQVMSPTFLCQGSVMYRDFRDEVVEMPRGLVVFDTKTGSINRVENPCTSIYHTIRVTDEDDLAVKLAAVPHKDRSHVKLSYPESCQPFVDTYKGDFRALKTVPLKERRVAVATGSASQSPFDPYSVVESFLNQNTSGMDDESRAYIRDLITKVLGSILQEKSRHHVRFKGLHAENFMSYLVLDIRFDENGVVYVDGVIQDQEADVSNGSGKSAIFEAINWCLFGDLVRNSKELEGRITVEDVVNDQTKSGCLVALEVDVDEVSYQVMRTRKHREYGDDLRIWHDGSLMAQGTTAAKKYLESITGTDQKLFKHTTLMVDSLSTRFSQLSGRDRLELMESVIQLGLYDKLYDAANADLKKVQAERDGVNISIGNDARVLQELRQQRDYLASNLESVANNLRLIIAKQQQELSAAVDEGSRLDKEIEIANNLAGVIRNECQSLQSAIPTFDSTQYNNETGKINRDLAIMRRTLDDKRIILTGQCPTCRRPMTSDPVLLEAEIRTLEASIGEWEKALVQWRDWEASSRSRIKSAEEAYRARSQAYVSQLEHVKLVSNQKVQLTLRVKGLQGDIQGNLQIIESNSAHLTVLDQRITAVDAELEKLKERFKGLDHEVTIRAYWDRALSPKGGVRMSLLQDSIAQLSEYAVEYSNVISNGRISPSLFITGKGEIGFETTQLAGNRKYGLSSSGQRRMVDLGIQLALSRLSSKFSGFTSNLMILDEVEDKLDASARRHLVTLLNKLADDDKKLVLIASHNKDIKSFVERVWLVTQSDGISRLTVAA